MTADEIRRLERVARRLTMMGDDLLFVEFPKRLDKALHGCDNESNFWKRYYADRTGDAIRDGLRCLLEAQAIYRALR